MNEKQASYADDIWVQELPRCEHPFNTWSDEGRCRRDASWDGWVRRSPRVFKACVCDEHKAELIGMQSVAPPVDEKATQG